MDIRGLHHRCVIDGLIFSVYFERGTIVANCVEYELKYVGNVPDHTYDKYLYINEVSIRFEKDSHTTIYCKINDYEDLELTLTKNICNRISEIWICYLLFRVNNDNKYLPDLVRYCKHIVSHYESSAIRYEKDHGIVDKSNDVDKSNVVDNSDEESVVDTSDVVDNSDVEIKPIDSSAN